MIRKLNFTLPGQLYTILIFNIIILKQPAVSNHTGNPSNPLQLTATHDCVHRGMDQSDAGSSTVRVFR